MGSKTSKGVSQNQEPAKEESQTSEWSTYELEALNAHNEYRANHGAPPMVLNRELCAEAQAFAEKLASEKAFRHSEGEDRKYNGESVGENLACGGTTDEPSLNIQGNIPVDIWYNEMKDYDHSKPGFGMKTGHFTQVVWNKSTELGQGFATYEDGEWTKIIYVGRYYPAGNVEGNFSVCVKPSD